MPGRRSRASQDASLTMPSLTNVSWSEQSVARKTSCSGRVSVTVAPVGERRARAGGQWSQRAGRIPDLRCGRRIRLRNRRQQVAVHVVPELARVGGVARPGRFAYEMRCCLRSCNRVAGLRRPAVEAFHQIRFSRWKAFEACGCDEFRGCGGGFARPPAATKARRRGAAIRCFTDCSHGEEEGDSDGTADGGGRIGQFGVAGGVSFGSGAG